MQKIGGAAGITTADASFRHRPFTFANVPQCIVIMSLSQRPGVRYGAPSFITKRVNPEQKVGRKVGR
jgi:hypothetical protein